MNINSHIKRERVLLLVGLVLVSLNLRVLVTTIGPIIDDIRDDAQLSSTTLGLLTTAPVLAFGLLAPLGPRLAGRFGMERVVFGCMIATGAGLALRLPASDITLFLGTAFAGCALAVTNVLLPGLVKDRFPSRAALMTGVYGAALGIGASVAAGLMVPIVEWIGSWRSALAIWALPAFVAAAAWWPQVRGAARPRFQQAQTGSRIRLWRDRIAWNLTAFTALQSLLFYACAAWLPAIHHAAGIGVGQAGGLLSLMLLVGIGSGFVAAVVAERLDDQRPLAIVTVGLTTIGLGGIMLVPDVLAALWVTVLGVGLGAGFTLSLTLMVLRAADPRHAAALSGMTQGIGYPVAACGPVLVGALYDFSGGWQVPLAVLLVLMPVQLVAALGASRPGCVCEGRRSLT